MRRLGSGTGGVRGVAQALVGGKLVRREQRASGKMRREMNPAQLGVQRIDAERLLAQVGLGTPLSEHIFQARFGS